MANLLSIGFLLLKHEDKACLLTQKQVFAFFACLGFDDTGIKLAFGTFSDILSVKRYVKIGLSWHCDSFEKAGRSRESNPIVVFLKINAWSPS